MRKNKTNTIIQFCSINFHIIIVINFFYLISNLYTFYINYLQLPEYVWSEEYQKELFSRHFEAFDRLRREGFFIGEFIWNFADFRTAQSEYKKWTNLLLQYLFFLLNSLMLVLSWKLVRIVIKFRHFFSLFSFYLCKYVQILWSKRNIPVLTISKLILSHHVRIYRYYPRICLFRHKNHCFPKNFRFMIFFIYLLIFNCFLL